MMQTPYVQVKNWTDCPPKPNCITVNVGDPLQFWSDGLLKSNYHRVRMPKEGEPLVCLSNVSLQSALLLAATLLAWQAYAHLMNANDSICCVWHQHFLSPEHCQNTFSDTLCSLLFQKGGLCIQDARYSIGWFVWPKDDVLIQGPAKKYPPTTMKEFMKVRNHSRIHCVCCISEIMPP